MTTCYSADAKLPTPSRLVLLADLDKAQVYDKVRFLGCVNAYCSETATLTLAHNYPRGSLARAYVDIELSLEGLDSTVVAVGSWVNVMGIVTLVQLPSNRRSFSCVHVQALMIWLSGPLELDKYERLVTATVDGLDG